MNLIKTIDFLLFISLSKISEKGKKKTNKKTIHGCC